MSLSRRLLYASEIWEVARPRTALTSGHLLIRLTNPSTAFDLSSAADWIRCHNAARQALAEVLGATHCTVLFAHQWHPIGSAIGEPEAESSTPTFHLFGRWDAEPVTPGEQLRLPTQRRVPVAAEELKTYDGGLRTALRRLALEQTAPARWHFAAVPAGETAANCHLAEPDVTSSAPRFKAGAHHTVLTTPLGTSGGRSGGTSDGSSGGSSGGTSDGTLTPGHLLAVAAALQGLTERPGVTGLSCVVPEPGGDGLEVHAMGRSAGEAVNPMQEFLALEKVSQALL